ncbi:MAG: Maf family protein [bacterium]|nr:Maf family protein [bacterium]
MPGKEMSPKLVIIPSTSGRRAEALHSLGDKIELAQLPGPTEELQDPDLSLVAQDKSRFAADLLQGIVNAISSNQMSEEEKSQFMVENINLLQVAIKILSHDRTFQIVGADTQTSVPEEQSLRSGDFEMISHGKPKDEAEVQRHFHNMNKLGASIYQVFSGSHIASYTPDYDMPIETRHTQKITVHLRPEAVKFFASDKGFAHYQQVFTDFYRSEAYKQNNLQPIRPTNISAGFSLPVFIQEQAVEAVELDGKKIKLSEANEEFLRKVIYAVAIGYSPVVLEQIFPGAYNFTIDNWHWLQEVVKEITANVKK